MSTNKMQLAKEAVKTTGFAFILILIIITSLPAFSGSVAEFIDNSPVILVLLALVSLASVILLKKRQQDSKTINFFYRASRSVLIGSLGLLVAGLLVIVLYGLMFRFM